MQANVFDCLTDRFGFCSEGFSGASCAKNRLRRGGPQSRAAGKKLIRFIAGRLVDKLPVSDLNSGMKLYDADLAKRYLKDADEAEDVVQDALLKLWQMHTELRCPMQPMAMVVTRNLSIDRLRRQHRKEPLGQIAEDEPQADERTERILSIIETLPTMQQTILRLRHLEEMEMKELAEFTRSTEVAVRKALSRARMAVRQQYLKKFES